MANNSFEAYVDPIQGFYGDSGFIAGVAISIILVEIMGNGLIGAVMVYEKHGMDPIKRTILNRLVYESCWLVVGHNLLSMPLVSYRLLRGPLGTAAASLAMHAMIFGGNWLFLAINEAMLLKVLYMYQFKHMACLSDDFAARFFTRFNYLAGGCLAGVKVLFQEFATSQHFLFLSGVVVVEQPTYGRACYKMTTVLLLVVSLSNICISAMLIKYQQQKNRKLEVAPLVPRYNTTAKNENLIGSLGLVIVTLLISIPVSMVTLMNLKLIPLFSFGVATNYMLLFIIPSLAIPGLFFTKKKKAIKIVSDLITA